MKIKVSKNLKDLSEIFKPYAKLFIVGGYIRNSILGFTQTDIDLASQLTPEKLELILKGTKFEIVSKSLEVGYVKIKCENEIYEHTTFRRDNYYENGVHKVKSVDYVSDLSQDAMRRDFSINALYYDIQTEKIIDIYSGLLDLKNGVIKTVEVPGYVLAHDGTRILRMIRFASELNFKIDYATLAAARRHAHLINDISPKQKFDELKLILTSSNKYPCSKRNAQIYGLGFFNLLHLWPSFYIPISRVKFRMLKKVSFDNKFMGLMIDIIDSVNPDCVEYFINEVLGKNGFCLEKSTVEYVNHIICGYYDAVNKMNNKFYFFKYFDNFERIAELLQSHSKKLYTKYRFFQNYIRKHNLPTHITELQINGDDLLRECPELSEKKFSTVLQDLLSKVFDGKVANDKKSLITEVKNDISNNRY